MEHRAVLVDSDCLESSIQRVGAAVMQSNFLRNLSDDHLYLPEIKEHSFEKFERHNTYARIFATGMKRRWAHRVYIGLYCGAGRARVTSSSEIVETTAMSVVRLPDQFTKYIFVDNDPRCTSALQARLGNLTNQPHSSVITGDVNECVDAVIGELPSFSKTQGLLCFCFVDPFAFNVDFAAIRKLSQFKVDFLVLLMLGVDVRRNFLRYYQDSQDDRIARMIDAPNWREAFDRSGEDVLLFVHRKFEEAMIRLRYQPLKQKHHHIVRAQGRGPLQYELVLYSRHELAQKFWESALSGANPQLGFW